jgi:hypothetical protein
MHIAIGYDWFPTAQNYYIECALRELGHTVTFIGKPAFQHLGYDHRTPVTETLAALPRPPDLYLHMESGGSYFPPAIEDLTIPTACYLVDVHLGSWRQQIARFFDVVFVAQKDYLDAYRRAVGHNQVYWLPLAAAPDVCRQPNLPKIYDVAFVGFVARAHRRTPRARRLALVSQRFKTNDVYRYYTHEELAWVYSQARIVLNITVGGDVNLRIFEGTACGALVLTDSAANSLGELYDIGREIVVYRDDTDMLDKIEYYLQNEDEMARIASAGYQRALAQHTYDRRAQQILETLTTSSIQLLAPMRRASGGARRTARRVIYTHAHTLDPILDEARAAGLNPLQRSWAILPCLIRRLLI